MSRDVSAAHSGEIHPGHDSRQRFFIERTHAGDRRQAPDEVGQHSRRDQGVAGDRQLGMTAQARDGRRPP
jgi:hypothetical protein